MIGAHAAQCHARIEYVEERKTGCVWHDVYKCTSSTCRSPDIVLPREREELREQGLLGCLHMRGVS